MLLLIPAVVIFAHYMFLVHVFYGFKILVTTSVYFFNVCNRKIVAYQNLVRSYNRRYWFMTLNVNKIF